MWKSYQEHLRRSGYRNDDGYLYDIEDDTIVLIGRGEDNGDEGNTDDNNEGDTADTGDRDVNEDQEHSGDEDEDDDGGGGDDDDNGMMDILQ